jgi:hypothetical protein
MEKQRYSPISAQITCNRWEKSHQTTNFTLIFPGKCVKIVKFEREFRVKFANLSEISDLY